MHRHRVSRSGVPEGVKLPTATVSIATPLSRCGKIGEEHAADIFAELAKLEFTNRVFVPGENGGKYFPAQPMTSH